MKASANTDVRDTITSIAESEPPRLFRVFRTLHRLKEIPRQGFVHFGFKRDETDSVADHSFMVAWIAYQVCRALRVDKATTAKATLAALVHDWGEAVVGDVSFQAKREAFRLVERDGFHCLIKELRGADRLKELWSYYEDFKEKATLPGAIVKFADGLEPWFQGIATTSTWWPAWETYNRRVFKALEEFDKDHCHKGFPALAERFRRTCDLARDPTIQIWVSDIADRESNLWNMVKFLRTIYSLKELPRHGFTMFGLKRKETDTFAGHGLSTASLALLIALQCDDKLTDDDLLRVVMVSLCHDLPVAITGDAAYDLQAQAGQAWTQMSEEALDGLMVDVPGAGEIRQFHKDWKEGRTGEAVIARTATTLDAWEMGATTPSAWMHAWTDYSNRAMLAIQESGHPLAGELLKLLSEGRIALGAFNSHEFIKGFIAGREPLVKPIRLGGT